MAEINSKRGRMIMFCSECGELDADGEPEGMWFYTSEKTFKGRCPKCRTRLNTFRCTRCGHRWHPRDVMKLAAVCPKCCSPYWNRSRVLDQKKDKEEKE